MVEYQSADHEQQMKILRPAPFVEEVSYPSARQASWSLDDLPRTVAMSLHQRSSVQAWIFILLTKPYSLLVQIMVKFHFRNLGCEKGWCQNHSRYGTYKHAHYHFSKFIYFDMTHGMRCNFGLRFISLH